MKPEHLWTRMAQRFGCRSLSTWIGLGISLLGLTLAFRSVNIKEVINALIQADLSLVIAAFVFAMLASVGSTMRWRELLSPYRPRPDRLFQVFMISHLGNTLLPWKLGTLLRIYLITDVENIALGFVMGTVAVERLLDALILALLFLAIVPTVALPRWLHDSGFGISFTVLPLFLALVAIVYFRSRLSAELRQHVHFSLPANLLARFDWLMLSIREGIKSFDILAQPAQYLAITMWSLMIWSAGALANEFVLRALAIHSPASTPIVLLVTLQVGNKVPTAPANLGIFHYVVILTLGLFGVSKAVALSYALILHTVVFLAPAIVGGICLWKWQRDFGSTHFTNLSERIRRTAQGSTP